MGRLRRPGGGCARLVVLASTLAVLGGPALLRAQPAEDAVPLPGGDESPELRTLRLAEERLFREPGEPTEGSAADVLSSGPRPPAPTPGRPETAPEPGERIVEGHPDQAWLAGLTLPDLPVRWDERVVDYLVYFRDDPRGQRLIQAWLSRLATHGPAIRDVLRAHGLPDDLVYVAMVESGFDPTARSGAGAVGLWQFVSRTGRAYGLRQDRFLDERMDPLASTRAAAEHLGDLHRRLGRWELALAAYNMGYGALLRSIRKYNTNDYWLLSHLENGLPFETALYVAKVVACAIAGHNPGVFGVDLDELDGAADAAPIAEVQVPGGTPLGLVARAARVDRDAVGELNPAYLRGRTPPDDGPWRVRLPAASLDAFARRWPRIARSRPAMRPYVVRLGEDLRSIARRFHTHARRLREHNGLEEDPAPGETILVPAVEPREAPADAGDGPILVAVPGDAAPGGDLARRFYQVRRGDTLSEIAHFCGVGVGDLVRWNALDPHAVLQTGMVIQVFVPEEARLDGIVLLSEDQVRTLALGSDEFFTVREAQDGRRRIEYRVRPGDTLTSIGRRFGLRPEDLARINQRSTDDLLQLGETLVIYAPGGSDAGDADASD